MGHVLPACVLECAVKKNALRNIEGGNDVQALANTDEEAESLSRVSMARGENLMIQTQTATACDIIKKKLAMESGMTNNSDQIMLVNELGRL